MKNIFKTKELFKRSVLAAACGFILVACSGGGGGGGGDGDIPDGATNLGALPDGDVVYSGSSSYTVGDNGDSVSGVIGIVGHGLDDHTLNIEVIAPDGMKTGLVSGKTNVAKVIPGLSITTSPSPCILNGSVNTSCKISIEAKDVLAGKYTFIPTFTDAMGVTTAVNPIVVNVLGFPGDLDSSLLTSALLIGESTTGTLKIKDSHGIGRFQVDLSSSDEKIATVEPDHCILSSESSSCDYHVTAVGAGRTLISASSIGYGTLTTPLAVNMPIVPGSIHINFVESNIYESQIVYGTVTLDKSSGVDPITLKIKSSDDRVASIKSSNCDAISTSDPICTFEVATNAAGTVQISASGDGYADTSSLTVMSQSQPGNLVLAFDTNNIYTSPEQDAVATIGLNNSVKISKLNVTINSLDKTIAVPSNDSCEVSSAQNICTVTIVPKGKGHTTISIAAEGYATQSQPIAVNESAVMGHLVLSIQRSDLNVQESSVATISLIGARLVENLVVNLKASESSVITFSDNKKCVIPSSDEGQNSCDITVTGGVAGSAVLQAFRDNEKSEASLNVNVKRQLVITAFVESGSFVLGGIGGVAGADKMCQTRVGATYKALIVDESGVRRACTSANCEIGGSLENLNWVLSAHQTYVNQLGQVVGMTNESGIFASSKFNNNMTPHSIFAPTGLNKDWTVSIGQTCDNWTSQISGYAIIGAADSLDVGSAISMGRSSCQMPLGQNQGGVICVETTKQ